MPKTFWVVLHGEVALTLQGPVVDEAVSFIASTRKSAERLMRKVWVEPGTWWRLEQARLDDIEGPHRPSILYSRSGRVIRTVPFDQGCRAAVRRDRRALKSIQKRLSTARISGLSRRELKNLTAAAHSLRRVLARWNSK